MAAYARLARLPRPRLEPVPVAEGARRVAALEPRRPVTVCPGPDVTIRADGGQLDQVLINLVRNAVDAALEGGGAVELGWTTHDGRLEVWVRDDGPGLADTVNLFVPFYTTKADGSGIGLALSPQIAEAHGGRLTLANREAAKGSEARVTLPILGPDLAALPGTPGTAPVCAPAHPTARDARSGSCPARRGSRPAAARDRCPRRAAAGNWGFGR